MKKISQEEYGLEKSIWTECDFEKMGWHDSTIYAWHLGTKNVLILDLDYIFRWVQSNTDKPNFKFWVSPCTLIFENVYDLKIDLEISVPFELKINDINRSNPQRPKNSNFINHDLEYNWTIDNNQGQIIFKSIGYKLFVRRRPILFGKQNLGLRKRKGISFTKRPVRI